MKIDNQVYMKKINKDKTPRLHDNRYMKKINKDKIMITGTFKINKDKMNDNTTFRYK